MEHNYCHGDDCYDEGERIEGSVAFANTPESVSFADRRESLSFLREELRREIVSQVKEERNA